MKVVRKEHLLLRGSMSVSQAVTEKQILQQMATRPHPFVVSLHYTFQDAESLYLLIDFVGGGDLFTLMESKGALPEPHVVVYAAELVLALEHVHSLHIIFRDLKPENVMVGMDGHLKLTDFGMSKRLERALESGVGEGGGDGATGGGGSSDSGGSSRSGSGHLEAAGGGGGAGGGAAARSGVTGTICGTPEYLAPEVLQGKPYTNAVDWWSLGCLVYEMLLNKPPFRSADMGILVQQIIKSRLDLPPSLSPAAVAILRGLLAPVERRLGAPPDGAASVKPSPFFADIDFEKLYKKEVAAPSVPSKGKHDLVGSRDPNATPTATSALKARHQGGIELLQREFTSWSAEKEGLSRSTSYGDLSAMDRSHAEIDDLSQRKRSPPALAH